MARPWAQMQLSMHLFLGVSGQEVLSYEQVDAVHDSLICLFNESCHINKNSLVCISMNPVIVTKKYLIFKITITNVL